MAGPVWAPLDDGFAEAVVHPPAADGRGGGVYSTDGELLDVAPDQCCPRGELPEGGYDDNTQVRTVRPLAGPRAPPRNATPAR